MKPKELKDKTKGIVHLVMTHFDKNGELDLKALRQSVKHVVGALRGENAVFLITGSTAEFYAMTDEENDRVIATVVEEVNGAVPIIAGTARAGTRWTIEASQRAQKLGVDGVMVVSPYYHLVTKEGLYNHFKAVAGNVDVGLMVYNNPVTSKLWIPPDLMARLSKIDNIVLDKENTASAGAYFYTQRAVDPADMKVICGLGQVMFTFEAVYGAEAYVTELANFAPQIAIGLARAAAERNFDKLAELANRVAPFHEFMARCAERRGGIPTVLSSAVSISEQPFYQSTTKQAMSLVGLPGGDVRAPMENITEQEKEELRAALKKMGVL
jgi:4-hydroxy-tetrahydrodipicolinate synthase